MNLEEILVYSITVAAEEELQSITKWIFK